MNKEPFFSADWHFGHVNIIRPDYTDRPWSSVDEMNKILIENWNSVVGPDDEHFIVGDLFMGRSIHWEGILNKLNGKLYLVAGNHDVKLRKQSYALSRFIWIKDYYELKLNKKLFIMCHYPLYTWNHAGHGAIMVHGHSHNSISDVNSETTRIDVGIDNPICEYKPITFSKIIEHMKDRVYKPVDHHNARTNQ